MEHNTAHSLALHSGQEAERRSYQRSAKKREIGKVGCTASTMRGVSAGDAGEHERGGKRWCEPGPMTQALPPGLSTRYASQIPPDNESASQCRASRRAKAGRLRCGSGQYSMLPADT
eukprot:1839434-Rhodomonas_salina.1